MSFVDWSSAYSVHHPLLDEQHQKLFSIINNLHDAMFAKKGREAVGLAIRELVEYTHKHFSEEERQMELRGYPGLAEHKRVHAELLKKVKDIDHQYHHSNESVAGEMIGFLVSDWLVKHILGMDKQYSPYFVSK